MTMFTRLVLLTAMLSLLALSACSAGEMSATPNVFVDASFGDNMPVVIDGLHVWPGIEPHIAIVSHADLIQLAGPTKADGAPNTIYLVVTPDTQQDGCPWPSDYAGTEAGLTHAHGDTAVSCVALDYVQGTADPGYVALKRVVAHEFGHALGLRFAGADGFHEAELGHLMSIDYMGPDDPTDADLAALHARFP